MIKVIASDLDGTLLRSDKTVSERTVKVLNECKNRGYKIVFATARPSRSVIKLLPQELQREFWLCQNGVELYEKGIKIYESTLDIQRSLSVIRLFEEMFPERPIAMEIDSIKYSNRIIEGYNEFEIVDLYKIVKSPVTKILIKADNIKDLEKMSKVLPEGCRMIIQETAAFAYVISVSASKTLTLKILLEKLGLKMENVISFGDDLNDIEMIKHSRIGVAMGNASFEVKRHATHVTKTNDEDGVAEFLEKLLL